MILYIKNMLEWLGITYLYKTIGQYVKRAVTVSTKTPSPIVLPTDDKKTEEYAAMLIFAISQDGRMDIMYDWKKMSRKHAEQYAKLLSDVNQGAFESRIIENLASIDDDPKVIAFSKQIIDKWKDIISKEEPFIGPLTLFINSGEKR